MKATIYEFRNETKAFKNISEAAKYAGLAPRTVRNYLSKHKTNIYQAKRGDKIIVVE